jgi:hypothetical protein
MSALANIVLKVDDHGDPVGFAILLLVAIVLLFALGVWLDARSSRR